MNSVYHLISVITIHKEFMEVMQCIQNWIIISKIGIFVRIFEIFSFQLLTNRFGLKIQYYVYVLLFSGLVFDQFLKNALKSLNHILKMVIMQRSDSMNWITLDLIKICFHEFCRICSFFVFSGSWLVPLRVNRDISQ